MIKNPILYSLASIFYPQYTQYFNFSENLEYQDSQVYQFRLFANISFPSYVQKFYNEYQPFAKCSENGNFSVQKMQFR